MKGNLSTLKKICRYASAVMLAGAFVLASLLVATVVMAAGSLLGVQALSDALSEWVGVGQVSSTPGAAAVAEMLAVLSLGAVTVSFIYRFMKAIEREHSPFNEPNVDAMRLLSKTYLAAAPAIAVADWFARGSLTGAMFLFFGSILVGVVVYCLALAFRYGSVLQKESDETLRGGDGYNTEAGQGHGGQEDVP